MTFPCRSCGVELEVFELVIGFGTRLLCPHCAIDCRCPPEGAPAQDPIEQLDHQRGDRGRVRWLVRAALYDVPWSQELTIGQIKDERCISSKVGNRCERAKGHHGPHHSGDWSWAGKAMYA